MSSATPRKILIIDDDNRNVFALSAVLRAKGYAPIAAASGAEGISHLRTQQDICIALVDMMMPEMDGYTLIPEIRKDATLPQVPMIAVTAQAMPGDKERCLSAGADGYLSKPIDIDKLVALLNDHLK